LRGFLKHQLLLLKKIQDIDIQIGLIEKEAQELNADAERLVAEIRRYEDSLEIRKNELDELANARRTLEAELIEHTDRIKKNEDRLKNIKNDKEFKASTKEMNTAKKDKLSKESEVIKLNATIDEKKGFVQEEEDGLRNKKDALEAKKLSIEKNKENVERVIKEKTNEKMIIANNVSSAVLKKYETIKEKRHGIAIVSAVAGICQGCHMNIPPQAYIHLQKDSSDLIFCPHCHRILYWNPIPETQEQEKGQPA
jgi:uncharacterized protein